MQFPMEESPPQSITGPSPWLIGRQDQLRALWRAMDDYGYDYGEWGESGELWFEEDEY